MTNQLTEVTKDQFFAALCAERKNVLFTTIGGGGHGNFYPLTDIAYYAPNQLNIFGKTIDFGTTNEHLNKYFLASK